MKKFDIETNNYIHKDALKQLVNDVSSSIETFLKESKTSEADLKSILSKIEKKSTELRKNKDNVINLKDKIEDLSCIKEQAKVEIKGLEDKKKSIDYSDNDVKKMELDDLDALINVKNGKIAKIEAKILSAKDKITASNENIKTITDEIKALEKEEHLKEETVFRTTELANFLNSNFEDFYSQINSILKERFVSDYLSVSDKSKEEEKVNEEKEDLKNEETLKEVTTEINVTDDEEIKLEKVEPSNSELDKPEDDPSEIEIPSLHNLEDIIIPVSDKETEMEMEESNADYPELLKDVFDKEVINFTDFSEDIQNKMINNADRVIKNVVVLKKHQIPLNLTLTEPDIYFNIDSQDLDDLLNIITSDENNNGMGYKIDYTYYILNELSNVDVDALIETYNNELGNISSKTGLIELLKKVNSNLGTFELNKKANMDTLRILGVNSYEEIAEKFPEIVNIDNPLFIDVLNTFDKEDLVIKLNQDINLIPKIYEYWKNN